MYTFYLILTICVFLFIKGYFRHRQAKTKVVRIIDTHCTGCRQCMKRCRHAVFEVLKDETGKRLRIKDPQACTACKNCLAVCKFNALELTDRKQPVG